MSQTDVARGEMSSPHVFVLVGDCLRAASATAETLPFLSAQPTVAFERCYSPGTWTRPSHASLYAGATPVEHGVTRRGDVLAASQAVLPNRARDHGYTTAVFSENPTFGTATGFHHGIDYVDDGIHYKPFRSAFSPDAHVDGVGPEAALTLLREVARRPDRARNLANLVYGLAARLSEPDPTTHPHHGDRVLAHLRSFVRANADRPVFCVANLLDAHNPHHAPPAVGSEALGLSVPEGERRALAAVTDDREYLFGDADLPPETRAWFDSWDEVFARRERVYEAQVRYLDHLIEEWVDAAGDVLDDALVVVTGDHGQLFGEEGQLGHQTSLHPHGVHVPLVVVPPASWTTPRRVEAPVTWVGLSRALGGVVDGSVTDTRAFVDRVVEGSRADDRGRVVVCVDGPTYDLDALREAYGDDAVAAVGVRRVGVVERGAMTVYESGWRESTVRRRTYDLRDGTRVRRDETTGAPPEEPYATWLRDGDERGVAAETSERLRQLGYL
jgi:arylsulfatase A-like enzyme